MTTDMAMLWGVPVHSLYQHVLIFYRKEKEQIRLEYNQRMELLALFKQVKLGPYSPEKDSGTGYFDVVGADRRKAWKSLGGMSVEEAQCRVIQLLEGACPLLKDTVLSEVKAEERLMEQQKAAENGHHKNESQSTPTESITENKTRVESPNSVGMDTVPSCHSEVISPAALAPASLWCNPKAARHFVAQLSSVVNGQGESTTPLTLAPRESVAVQVPTSPQANAVFWEFVTESGDIGFGLRFQRGKQLNHLLPVTVRDCSQDLILGSHQYQDEGIYTLEFVNSHSTIPKVVHYRVFYQTSS